MPKQKKPEQEKPALEEIADEDAEEREYARRESIKSRLLCTISGGFITSAGYVFLTSHIEYAHERAAIFQEQLSRAPELTAASFVEIKSRISLAAPSVSTTATFGVSESGKGVLMISPEYLLCDFSILLNVIPPPYLYKYHN